MKKIDLLLLCLGLFSAGAASAITVLGTYSVPVPESLAKNAQFEKVPVEWDEPGGRLLFTLPEDLSVGDVARFELSRTGSAQGSIIAFQGKRSEGSCFRKENIVTCLVQVHYEVPSIDQIRSFFGKKYPNAPDLQSRIEVAKLFSSEPSGGVLVFALP